MKFAALLRLVFIGALFTTGAFATYLDLTVPDPTGTKSGFIGSGFFVRNDASSTGTGVIDTFVQITGTNEVKSAFNTTVNNVLDNGSADNFNHSLLLSDFSAVLNPYTGISSYRFLLDINEVNNAADRYLSLDSLQVWRSSTNNPNSLNALTNPATSTLLYDMNGVNGSLTPTACRNAAGGVIPCDTQNPIIGQSGLLTDYSLNTGSGSGDLFFYLPTTLFASGVGDYIYLYSKFGEVGDVGGRKYGQSDGFEEWARVEGGGATVPEPGFYGLLSLGLVGLGALYQKRRKQSQI